MSTQPIGLAGTLSRIEQIQAYQQQLQDPAAALATKSTATSGAAATTGVASSASASTSSTSAGTDFASLLSALQSSSSSPSSTSAAPMTAATTDTGASDVPAAVGAMTTEADSLLGRPYVWGGGHSGWGAQPGYDCSGFVSAVLHAGGYLSSPQDSSGFASAAGMESGPGEYVTVYDRTDGYDGQAGHVIIDLDGQFYESGGEHGAWGGGGGVAKIGTPSAQYLATFNRILHPAGL